MEHFSDATDLAPEKLLLQLKVKTTNVGAEYGFALSGDNFRLLVDGVPLAPTKGPISVLGFRLDLDSEVAFVMPGSAKEVLLQLGELAGEKARVAMDLSSAHR